MGLRSAFSPTKETSHCFRRLPALFLFVWPWKARSVLWLALLRLSARSLREAAAVPAAFCRGGKGKKDSASAIPFVLLSFPPSLHKGGFVCAQEPTKKFGCEMSSPLEKREGVEDVAYNCQTQISTRSLLQVTGKSWLLHYLVVVLFYTAAEQLMRQHLLGLNLWQK